MHSTRSDPVNKIGVTRCALGATSRQGNIRIVYELDRALVSRRLANDPVGAFSQMPGALGHCAASRSMLTSHRTMAVAVANAIN
jgi:hypothetical protein